MFTYLLVFTFCTCFAVTKGWDSDEFELFDLVEEVNQNFYEILGVSNDASSSEIRKAYRKLSMQMHPDKNKEEGAEEKFRQINAIYETLKDEGKRAKYDHVLEFGLPDWQQPVYYYRKVRKLGLLETAAMVFCIFTVGHFLIIWAAYFEKKFEVEEVFKSRKKKEKKSRRNKTATAGGDESEDALQELLQTVPRPKLTDLLPFKCVRGCVGLCKGGVAALYRLPELMKPAAEANTEGSEDDQASLKTRRKRVDLHLEKTPEMAAVEEPVNYTVASVSSQQDEASSNKQQETEVRRWTSEDDHMLAKAVAKYPGGTIQRWEKISAMLNRPVNVVIQKAKSIQSDYNRTVEASAQGITGTSDTFSKNKKLQQIENIEISTRSRDDVPETVARRRVRTAKSDKTADRTLMIATHSVGNNCKVLPDKLSANGEVKENDLSTTNNTHTSSIENSTKGVLKVEGSDVWSQNQQKILEWSLTQYPKGSPDRWDKIAAEIPGKTKEDCILRFKLLASIVQKKKQSQQH